MATGNEILAYTGNAELGSGSNPNIPVMDTAAVEKANSIVSDTAKNLLLMNHENNLKLYAQKIADRDKQLEMLEKGEIATGEILDVDRPKVNALKEQSRKKFDEMIAKGGINNQKAYKDYLDSHQEYTDAVTHAQHKQLGSTGLDTEIAKETNPYKRDQLKKFKKEQDDIVSKDFWGNYGQYQQLFDWKVDFMDGYDKGALIGGSGQPTTSTTEKVVTGPQGTTTTQTTKPNTIQTAKGIVPIQGNIVKRGGKTYEVLKQHYDYNVFLNNAQADSLKPSGQEAASQQAYFDAVSNAPDSTSVTLLNHLVDQWNKYQSDNGIVEGDLRYKKFGKVGDKDNPIAVIDPKTGRKVINLTSPELAAMSSLAKVQGSYAPIKENWLEESDKFELEQQKVKDARRKADLDRAESAQEARARIGLGYSELQENRDWHNFQKTLPKNQQDKADAISKEAIEFTDNLMTRIKDATDANGFVDLTKLSSEDLKILGKGVKEKGQFTLDPMSSTSKLKFVDGEINEVDADGNLKSGGKKTAQMLAGNRIMDQITSATGTEFGDFSILEKYYKNIQKEDKKSGRTWWGLDYKNRTGDSNIKGYTEDGLPKF